jgi:hypothetical protein
METKGGVRKRASLSEEVGAGAAQGRAGRQPGLGQQAQAMRGLGEGNGARGQEEGGGAGKGARTL